MRAAEPRPFGRPRLHLRLTGSTNEEARRLLDEGAPSGTVVTADEQSAGRGRHGRRWSAPARKALLASFLIRDLDERHSLLPLAVPLAVCETAEALGAPRCMVKWPNDVWISGRKAAGVLIEGRPPQWAVIGIGINVSTAPDEFPPELRETASSVGAGADVEQAMALLCEALERWLEPERERVLVDFRRRDALRGREIEWVGAGRVGDGKGLAEGVDEAGNLLVRQADGDTVVLGSGEVHLATVG